mmetsp:Transcript_966/g.2693  ORF Transcript_966/g.2693 Transcript_966/m.2693 type:complete len:302 (-) Transcript_966:521-1426(-)
MTTCGCNQLVDLPLWLQNEPARDVLAHLPDGSVLRAEPLCYASQRTLPGLTTLCTFPALFRPSSAALARSAAAPLNASLPHSVQQRPSRPPVSEFASQSYAATASWRPRKLGAILDAASPAMLLPCSQAPYLSLPHCGPFRSMQPVRPPCRAIQLLWPPPQLDACSSPGLNLAAFASEQSTQMHEPHCRTCLRCSAWLPPLPSCAWQPRQSERGLWCLQSAALCHLVDCQESGFPERPLLCSPTSAHPSEQWMASIWARLQCSAVVHLQILWQAGSQMDPNQRRRGSERRPLQWASSWLAR